MHCYCPQVFDYNHTPLFVPLRDFSVRADLFRQDKLTEERGLIIAKAFCKSLLLKSHQEHSRELQEEKGKAYPKVDEGCFGKMDCILSLPRISFIALSKSSNVFFQGLQSHISIVLDVGLDFQYYWGVTKVLEVKNCIFKSIYKKPAMSGLLKTSRHEVLWTWYPKSANAFRLCVIPRFVSVKCSTTTLLHFRDHMENGVWSLFNSREH